MSYDVKYRQRTRAYWNDGHSKRATAQVFGINAYTLQKWKSQLKETGDLKPRKCREVWRKIEPLRRKKYVEHYPVDLDQWVRQYNEERTHSGKYCYGKTPMQTFIDSIPLAKEKLFGHNVSDRLSV